MGIKAPFIDILASELNLKAQNGMIPMEVSNAWVALDDGLLTSDMKLSMGGAIIGATNTIIEMATDKIKSMDLLIPSKIIPKMPKGYVKDTLTVPVTGTLSSPSVNFTKAITGSVDVGKAAGSVLDNLLGGSKKGPDAVPSK